MASETLYFYLDQDVLEGLEWSTRKAALADRAAAHVRIFMGYGITAEKLYDDAAKAKLSTDRTNPVYEWFTIVEQEAFNALESELYKTPPIPARCARGLRATATPFVPRTPQPSPSPAGKNDKGKRLENDEDDMAEFVKRCAKSNIRFSKE